MKKMFIVPIITVCVTIALYGIYSYYQMCHYSEQYEKVQQKKPPHFEDDLNSYKEYFAKCVEKEFILKIQETTLEKTSNFAIIKVDKSNPQKSVTILYHHNKKINGIQFAIHVLENDTLACKNCLREGMKSLGNYRALLITPKENKHTLLKWMFLATTSFFEKYHENTIRLCNMQRKIQYSMNTLATDYPREEAFIKKLGRSLGTITQSVTSIKQYSKQRALFKKILFDQIDKHTSDIQFKRRLKTYAQKLIGYYVDSFCIEIRPRQIYATYDQWDNFIDKKIDDFESQKKEKLQYLYAKNHSHKENLLIVLMIFFWVIFLSILYGLSSFTIWILRRFLRKNEKDVIEIYEVYYDDPSTDFKQPKIDPLTFVKTIQESSKREKREKQQIKLKKHIEYGKKLLEKILDVEERAKWQEIFTEFEQSTQSRESDFRSLRDNIVKKNEELRTFIKNQ